MKKLRKNINLDVRNEEVLAGAQDMGKSAIGFGRAYKKKENKSKSNAVYQKFLNNLHQNDKKWNRYIDVLNNQTTIDPNALKNKYLQHKKEQDKSLYIHRHEESSPLENPRPAQKTLKPQHHHKELGADGLLTERTHTTKNALYLDQKHVQQILKRKKDPSRHLKKHWNEEEQLRDNIARRRQTLENQEQSSSPQHVGAGRIVSRGMESKRNKAPASKPSMVMHVGKVPHGPTGSHSRSIYGSHVVQKQ